MQLKRAFPLLCGVLAGIALIQHVIAMVCPGARPPGTPGRDPIQTSSGCTGCKGGNVNQAMAAWLVHQPDINLVVLDEPLAYDPSFGPRIGLMLSCQLRDKDSQTLNTNVFNVGKGWNSSWLSYVEAPSGGSNKVFYPSGDNGYYVAAGDPDYKTNQKLEQTISNSVVVAYSLVAPDGSKNVYSHKVTDAGGTWRMFMTEVQDPYGQKLKLVYSTPSGSNGVVRLLQVLDAAGMTTTINYSSTNVYGTNLIASVADPYGRTAYFEQDTNGLLTKITDPGTLQSWFVYGTNVNVTSIVTPYGTTSFTYDSYTGTNHDGRFVEITEPDFGKQLFMHKDNAAGLPSSYAQTPTTSPFTNFFENSELNLRNSFYWDRLQRSSLSTTNISSLTSTDFKIATLRHWLKEPNGSVSWTLSMMRLPSPDQSEEGQKTWYDYSAKANANTRGTQIMPLFEAKILPDGTTRFERTLRNTLGTPTQVDSTYSTDAGISIRTRVYTLAGNGIDVLRITNTCGCMVSSNEFNAIHLPTYSFTATLETNQYYYSSGQLTGVAPPTGATVTNAYNASGQLTSRTLAGIRTDSYTYANGLVRTHTDSRGLTVTNTWDALRRLVRVDYPDGTYTEDRYHRLDGQSYANSSGGTNLLDRTASRDREGHWTYFSYDSLRRLVAETNALNVVTAYGYCECGGPSYITNALGTAVQEVTTHIYDMQGRRTITFAPDGSGLTNVYDALGNITIRRDGFGSVTNAYNNQGLLCAVTNTFGRVQAILYDSEDRLSRITDAAGTMVTNSYDESGRLTRKVVVGVSTNTFGYSARGMIAMTNALGIRTLYDYDAFGHKIAETNGQIQVIRYSYTSSGDLQTLTDAKGNQTTWEYDTEGRVKKKKDANGATMFTYTYSPDGALSNRVDGMSRTTAYTYDATGHLTNVDYPSSTDLSFAYDALGRMTNMTDSIGSTVLGYALGGNLAFEDGPWSEDRVALTYTGGLRTGLAIASPNAGSWQESYGYDSARRLGTVTGPMGTFIYNWSAASSWLTNLTLANNAVITNEFDTAGRLLGTTLRNSAGTLLNRHSYIYNAGNQRTKQTRVDGSYVDYTYDNAGQLVTATGSESGGSARLNEKVGYAYDAAGNLARRTNNALIQSLSVNNLNELTTGSRSGTLTLVGTSSTVATNVTVNGSNASLYQDGTFALGDFAVANGDNTFTAIAQDSNGRKDTNAVTAWLPSNPNWTYDSNGNMTGDGRRVFLYDDENQLTSVYVTNSWKSGFAYDGKMRRRERTESTWASGAWVTNLIVHYVYDGMLLVQEGHFLPHVSMTVPNETVTYTRGLDLSRSREGAGGIGGLLTRTDSSSTAYYHTDANGNVTALLDPSQAVVARYLYDPYGKILSASGPIADANLYRFSSKELHACSGLYYYGYRLYEPHLQRWLTRDPAGRQGGNNLFAFVGSQPTQAFDPDGRKWRVSPILAPVPGNIATIGCKNGKAWPSVPFKSPQIIAQFSPATQAGYYCAQKCKFIHEWRHADDAMAQDPSICTGVPNGVQIENPDRDELDQSEIHAHTAELVCLRTCAPCAIVNDEIRREEDKLSKLYE